VKQSNKIRVELFENKLNQTKQKSTIWNRVFVHNTTVTAVKGLGFVSDRISYIVLRGFWCDILVLNVHAPSEEKSDDSKDSFYEELSRL